MPIPVDPLLNQEAWWNAIAGLNLSKVQALLNAGSDPNQRTSPLHDSALDLLVNRKSECYHQAADLITVLLQAGADPFVPPDAGNSSAFDRAMSKNDGEVLARAMVMTIDWDFKPFQGHKALLLAVRFHPHLVVPLLDRGVQEDNQSNHDRKRSVLSEALSRGPVDLVAQLLDRGFELSARQKDSNEDLFLLVTRGGGRLTDTIASLDARRLGLINVLHERGHRMNATARAQVILQAVKNRCSVPFLHRLVELGADPRGTTPRGLNALHHAVTTPGGYGYITPLMDMGVDPTAPNHDKQTAIARLLHVGAPHREETRAMAALMESRVLATTLGALSTPSEPTSIDKVPRVRSRL